MSDIKNRSTDTKRDISAIYSTDVAEEIKKVLSERDELKRRISAALHLIEFNKYLCGEDFVRNRIIKTLKG